MNVEWSIPFAITTPYGTLPLNSEEIVSGVTLVLDPAKCGTSAGIRLTRDNISQGDGSIIHREFTEGYVMRFGGWLMLDKDTPACDSDLRSIWEEIQRHLHSLLGNDVPLDGDNARITWQPTGYGDTRLLGNIRLLEEAVATLDGGITDVAFAIHSPYPFAVSGTEQMETVTEGAGSIVITNGGNVPAYPNMKLNGLIVGQARVNNETSGKSLVYDTALPGAVVIGLGDYGFVGTFAQNIYLNGSGLNLKPGIDVEQTDFWTLEPGDNTISLEGDSGITADIIWNDAWY